MRYVTVRMETPMNARDRDDYPPLPPMTTGPSGKCPRCGQGSIFKGFLSCMSCVRLSRPGFFCCCRVTLLLP